MTSPAAASKSAPTYYVSLGDSYSVGYQPGFGATPGYTVYVADKTHLKLVNFGCGGATTTSIVATVGCPDPLPHTTGAVLYPTTTQAAAAEAFLTAHRGHIGLITVSIAGNDVTACAGQANPISCVGTADQGHLRPTSPLWSPHCATSRRTGVPLIGLTYPDVILGSLRLSLTITHRLECLAGEALRRRVQGADQPGTREGVFIRRRKARRRDGCKGAYTSLTRTVRLRPYGRIPVPVASVCNLTWFCSQGNIHAKTTGYTLIGKLVVARYAVMRRR